MLASFCPFISEKSPVIKTDINNKKWLKINETGEGKISEEE